MDEFLQELLPARAADMNALPFVRWDRCTGDYLSMVAYGWIDRDDGRSDFVLLTWDERGLGYTTSSARYSDEINRLLAGEEHEPCQKIPDVFGGQVERIVSSRRNEATSEATAAGIAHEQGDFAC